MHLFISALYGKYKKTIVQRCNIQLSLWFILVAWAKHSSLSWKPIGDHSRLFNHIVCICCRFFSLIGAYLLFGWIFTRFVRKKRGWKQIPNAEFWQEIGHLQAVSEIIKYFLIYSLSYITSSLGLVAYKAISQLSQSIIVSKENDVINYYHHATLLLLKRTGSSLL